MMPSSRIFEAIHSGLTQLSCELEKYVLRNVLVVNQAETVVLLTDNYLVLCDNVASPYATHYCRLGFDVKF